MEIARATAEITESDLKKLLHGSFECIRKYFVTGAGAKWKNLYDIEHPLAVALCQGAAMHYYDKSNGVKDFDVWFFYPFNSKHLPYRTVWHWDYANPKFGRHPQELRYKGRKVDVIVRSIRRSVTGRELFGAVGIAAMEPASAVVWGDSQRSDSHLRAASFCAIGKAKQILKIGKDR